MWFKLLGLSKKAVKKRLFLFCFQEPFTRSQERNGDYEAEGGSSAEIWTLVLALPQALWMVLRKLSVVPQFLYQLMPKRTFTTVQVCLRLQEVDFSILLAGLLRYFPKFLDSRA